MGFASLYPSYGSSLLAVTKHDSGAERVARTMSREKVVRREGRERCLVNKFQTGITIRLF